MDIPTQTTTPTTTTTAQPEPIPKLSLSLVEAALPLPITAHSGGRTRISTHQKWKSSRFDGIRHFFTDTLAVLQIIFLYIIPGMTFVVLVAALLLVLPLAIFAAQGALAMFIGNAILRAAHLARYTNHASAAAIGATGACIAGMIVGCLKCFIQCLPRWLTEAAPPPPTWDDELGVQQQQQQAKMPWYTVFCSTVLVNTLSGTIGCAILLHNHVDLGGIDVLHATRAGALGGAMTGFGMMLIGPVILGVLMIMLSPLWIAMMMGLKWVYSRSNESWTDRSHSYSHCNCYGTCGGDSEIDHEIAQITRREY